MIVVQLALYVRFRIGLGAPGVREPAAISDETGVPLEIVRSIGSYDGEKRRRDLSQLARSHPSTIRIGAFGEYRIQASGSAVPNPFKGIVGYGD